MHTQYISNNYLSNLSLYIKLHRFIKHDKSWHEHKTKSNYTLWIIYQGNVWIEINQKVYKTQPGDVILFYPSDTYSAFTDEYGCHFLFFIFSLALGNSIDILSNAKRSGIYRDPSLSKRSLEFTKEYIERGYNNGGAILKLYSFFLDYLSELTEYENPSIPFEAFSYTMDNLQIHKLLEYINENFTKDITIKTLAEMVDMNERSFIRYFHGNIGTSPKRYIIEKRMQYAGELLKDKENSITYIASQTGYSDPYCFSKAFRKYYGDSPSAYRKSLTETRL
jgi:AraC-like DNA-binding protein